MWSSCESPLKGKLTETSLHILSDTLADEGLAALRHLYPLSLIQATSRAPSPRLAHLTQIARPSRTCSKQVPQERHCRRRRVVGSLYQSVHPLPIEHRHVKEYLAR